MMLSGGSGEDAMEVIKKCVQILVAKFDTVQIFASKHHQPSNKTFHATAGFGNWYARYGQVTEWVNASEQSAFERSVREREDQEDDDDDDDENVIDYSGN